MAIAGTIAVILLGRYAVQDGSIDDERRKLGDVELFQGLNPAAIETAMRAATVVRYDGRRSRSFARATRRTASTSSSTVGWR